MRPRPSKRISSRFSTPSNWRRIEIAMRTVNVALGDRSYRILIGGGLLKQLGSECRGLRLGLRGAVVADQNVAPAYGTRCLAVLRAAGFDPVLVTVPAG